MAEDKIYLTVDDNPKGEGFLAIITQGQPQLGDKHCTVLTLEIVKSNKEAHRWYERMLVERPWEARN